MQGGGAVCYNKTMQMSNIQAAALSSVTLAFMGDAVHSQYVRHRLISQHDYKSGELTRLSSRYVCARAQAKMMQALSDTLSDEEREVARRGENTHTNNKPKNADRAQYRLATALEALLGFLYLTGQRQRLEEILDFTYREEFIK